MWQSGHEQRGEGGSKQGDKWKAVELSNQEINSISACSHWDMSMQCKCVITAPSPLPLSSYIDGELQPGTN